MDYFKISNGYIMDVYWSMMFVSGYIYQNIEGDMIDNKYMIRCNGDCVFKK